LSAFYHAVRVMVVNGDVIDGDDSAPVLPDIAKVEGEAPQSGASRI